MKTINVKEFIRIGSEYDQLLNEISDDMNAIVGDKRHENGLVYEEVRMSTEYKSLKAKYKYYFSLYQSFNRSVPNKIKREASKIRRAKMMNK